MTYLTKPIADALCTVITLGFAKKHRQKTGEKMIFQYAEDNSKKAYEDVQRLFKIAEVEICISKSVDQAVFPYILGTSFPKGKIENLKKSLLDFKTDVDKMMDAANTTELEGAYIGILCTVDIEGNIVKVDGKREIYLYGPSALSQYQPVYRSLDNADIRTICKAYERAKTSTNNAVAAILSGLADKGVKIVHGFEYAENYKGGLFRSDHGMIRAMVNRSEAPADQFNVYSELALGKKTGKVSSCVPCAIFMQSFEYPASSVHLGRGDNWGIPDGDKLSAEKWAANVCGYFDAGIEALRINRTLRLHVKDTDKLCELTSFQEGFPPLDVYVKEKIAKTDNYSVEIPRIFLESLTFEGTFASRISRTFEAANIRV